MTLRELPKEALARSAIVYVRQSTGMQVQENRESQRRQYELAELARRYGFRDVSVIDEDIDIAFVFAADRSGQTLRQVLGGTHGTLLVDAEVLLDTIERDRVYAFGDNQVSQQTRAVATLLDSARGVVRRHNLHLDRARLDVSGASHRPVHAFDRRLGCQRALRRGTGSTLLERSSCTAPARLGITAP